MHDSPSSTDVLGVGDTQVITAVPAVDSSPAGDSASSDAGPWHCSRCRDAGPHCDRCLNCSGDCQAAADPALPCGEPAPPSCQTDPWCVEPAGHDGPHVDRKSSLPAPDLCAPAPVECGADWGSGTLSQRCQLPAGHDGQHIDSAGAWPGGDRPYHNVAAPAVVDAGPAAVLPVLVAPPTPPLARVPFNELASALVEILGGLSDLADLVFVERGGFPVHDLQFTPDRLAVQATYEVRDGAEQARRGEVERLASVLGVIPLREPADGFDWYVARRTFGIGRVMYAAVTRVEPLMSPLAVTDWEAARRELAGDVVLVDDRESEPVR